MKKRPVYLLFVAATLALSGTSLLSMQSSKPQTPACSAAQLSFALDDENSYFNGMSHSGTLLVVRNMGPNLCTMLARPIVSFEDASHHTLPLTLEAPRGMHPGPVILPIVIPVGAEVTSEIRWVSSDAFGGNNSVSPAYIVLALEGATLRAKFTAQLFGPAGKHPTYSMTIFKRDPIYIPSKY